MNELPFQLNFHDLTSPLPQNSNSCSARRVSNAARKPRMTSESVFTVNGDDGSYIHPRAKVVPRDPAAAALVVTTKSQSSSSTCTRGAAAGPPDVDAMLTGSGKGETNGRVAIQGVIEARADFAQIRRGRQLQRQLFFVMATQRLFFSFR